MGVQDETAGAPAATGGARSDPNGRRAAGDHRSFFGRHRRALATALAGLITASFVYFVLPQIMGLGTTLRRLSGGDMWWLVLGMVLEAISIFGQIVLFHGVFSDRCSRVGWKVGYQITLAGSAATKLLATAGAGGVALTVWALRADGLPGAEVATGMVCYDIINYFIYMAALAIVGFGLWLGLLSGPAPVGITLIPAIFGTVVIVLVLSMLFIDEPVARWLERRADRSTGRVERWYRRLASWPRALQAGLKAAIALIRHKDAPTLLGAVAGWAFDIRALWASFRAFGHSPPGAVLVMGYYVGTLGNTLPLPGGVGGVEGGMIGSFLAFGVNGGLAVLAVLAYRTISYWLPTIPGAIAYVRLRHTLPDGRTAHAAGGDERAGAARSA